MSARNKATAANGTTAAVAELPDKHKAGQLSGWHLDVGRYTFIRTLGVGTYGEVYMARDNRRSNISGQDFTVAIKCVPVHKFAFTEQVYQLIQQAEQRDAAQLAELKSSMCSVAAAGMTPPSTPSTPLVPSRAIDTAIGLHSKFPPFTVTPRTSRLNMEVGLQLRLPPHPNVVHIHRVLYVNNVIFIVMEHIDGTDMYHRIINHRSFTRMRWPEHNLTVRNVFTQLVDAVAHCHRHGVYHRDLKPENIILIENDIDRSQEEGVFTAKIVDFGLATDKAWADEIGCGSKFYISPDGNGGLGAYCNNPKSLIGEGWRASGASLGFLGRVTNYATGPNDVWALGVILVNLASGRNPWNQAIPTDPLFAMHLKNPDFLSGMLPITRTFAAILRAIFTIDPVERVSLRRLRTMVMDCEEFMDVNNPRLIGRRSTRSSTTRQQQQQVLQQAQQQQQVAATAAAAALAVRTQPQQQKHQVPDSPISPTSDTSATASPPSQPVSIIIDTKPVSSSKDEVFAGGATPPSSANSFSPGTSGGSQGSSDSSASPASTATLVSTPAMTIKTTPLLFSTTAAVAPLSPVSPIVPSPPNSLLSQQPILLQPIPVPAAAAGAPITSQNAFFRPHTAQQQQQQQQQQQHIHSHSLKHGFNNFSHNHHIFSMQQLQAQQQAPLQYRHVSPLTPGFNSLSDSSCDMDIELQSTNPVASPFWLHFQ